MRIEYISHSCLYIDTGDTSLVIDPWFKGGAYMDQWQLFPKPVDISMMKNVKNILYSHGHEDHLHPGSMKELSKEATVFFPYQWRKGIREFLASEEFHHVTEAVSFRKYKVSDATFVTYIAFALESVIVIEHGDIVIVNINDALNSHHQNVVNMFLKEIKTRWPKIDFLFSGWSGAGYFPNTVHYKGKDDVEVARIREQYFGNNFCKSIQYLQPEIAIPFAPGFALIAEDKQWINDIKFPREVLESYYRENFDANTRTRFCIVNPGDYFDGKEFHAVSPYYEKMLNGSLNHLIGEIYSSEIATLRKSVSISEAKAEKLSAGLRRVVNENIRLFEETALEESHFSIRIKDLAVNNYFYFEFLNGKFSLSRSSELRKESRLLIHTTSRLLQHSLDHEWGGDVLTIGYGIDVDVFEERTLEQNLDIICVRLLTRYPTASASFRKSPLRAMGYFLRHPIMSKLAIRQKLMLRNAINKFPYNERDHWITYNKCELCKVCDLPEMSFEFGESLGK